MNQASFAQFFDSIYDAIGADIVACGGFKVVAAKLWPADPIATSAARLRNGLNADQPQKLDASEILAIKKLAREHGSEATAQYEAEACGYQIKWVEPEDEALELRRQLRDELAVANRLMARIEKADERAAAAPLKVIK